MDSLSTSIYCTPRSPISFCICVLIYGFSITPRTLGQSASTSTLLTALTIFCGIANENVLPFPYSLSTWTLPPISSTSSFTMASPSPVPSTLRFRLLSTCSNELNSFSISCALIPIPVSFTAHLSKMVSASIVLLLNDRTTWPSCVNLIALLARFTRICLIRTSSPISSYGMVGSKSTINSIGFTPIRLAMMLETSRISFCGSYSTGMIDILPASSFE